jgi:2,4-diaminopentanoate dehydrogenase
VKRYRIAQWGTGAKGKVALRAIIEHPSLDLVAVKVYTDRKVGQDAGDLCGVGKTGVLATKDIEEIVQGRPDCVVYTPDSRNVDEMCRLLQAGINITTLCLGLNHRDTIDPTERARLEAACSQGRSSLYATGSSPGWGTEIMPLALSIPQRRFECLTITDFSDLSAVEFSAKMMFEHMHFGADPDSLDPNEPIGTGVSTPPTLSATAQALGLTINRFNVGREFACAKNNVELSMGTVKAGTIGAIRMQVEALYGDKVVLRRRSIWYVTKDIHADWDLRESGFHYRVEGDVPLDVLVRFDVPLKEFPAVGGRITANPVVNAIPYVCEAMPGIRQTHELPLLVPVFAP